jgi:hypothetical protein
MVRGVFLKGMIAVFLCVLPGLAQTVPPKPDLHAGGANPSLIPNHQTTEVKLPGTHLSGTTVTASGAVCTLKSYKVVSDTEIMMMIEGHREIGAEEDGCFIKVHQGTFAAGTYVVVDLTEAEKQEKNRQQREADKAKGQAYMAGLGRQWTLHYSNGTSETFSVKPADEGELPEFQSATGAIVKIMTTSDNKVMVMGGDGCMRQGTLVNGEVKDGSSMGNCNPAGAWTGQKK